jgi:hypothetical protein
MRLRVSPMLGLLALIVGLAGCDKCGNPIRFNTPKVPGSCYATTSSR